MYNGKKEVMLLTCWLLRTSGVKNMYPRAALLLGIKNVSKNNKIVNVSESAI